MEIKCETDGRKPCVRNYTGIDDPARESCSGMNTRSIQAMVKKKDGVKESDH